MRCQKENRREIIGEKCEKKKREGKEKEREEETVREAAKAHNLWDFYA